MVTVRGSEKSDRDRVRVRVRVMVGQFVTGIANFGIVNWNRLYRPIFTAQCTLVQSAVLGSHVVRLSVRL